MRTKTLVILLIILAVLAGIGTLVMRSKAPEVEDVLGKPLMENLPVNEISSISLKDHKEFVSLMKKSDQWVVTERFDYPADFPKIADFVRKLKSAKIGRQFESSDETLKRLSLRKPDADDAKDAEKGAHIQLKDKSGKVLASLVLGEVRKGGTERSFPDGHYVRLEDSPTVYLIDTHFAYLQKKPSDWLDKDLLKVDANEVKKISCLSADRKEIYFTFERPEKRKDLEAQGLSASRKVDQAKLNRLAKGLSSLQAEDVLDPSDNSFSADLKRADHLEYELFNGMLYRVYPGKPCADDDRCYLRLEAGYEEPAPMEEDKSAEDTSKKEAPAEETAKEEVSKEEKPSPDKTPEEMRLEAKKLNDRFSPWVYVISNWQHEAFVTNLDQLLEKPKEEQKGEAEEKS